MNPEIRGFLTENLCFTIPLAVLVSGMKLVGMARLPWWGILLLFSPAVAVCAFGAMKSSV